MAKVLIVDDEEHMCLTLEQILDSAGHHSVIAREGKSALEKVEKEAFDVVLLDIRLPGMDGIQVLGKIKVIIINLSLFRLTPLLPH